MVASVQLPAGDRSDLDGLAADLGDLSPEHRAEVHPFDGMLAAQILVPLTAAATAVLKQWLETRAESRKPFRIFIDGVEFSGLSRPEVERLLVALTEASEPDDRV